jgi:cytidine/deoxycytidylate deaminase family protein
MIEPQVKGDEWFMAKALEQAQLAFEAGEIPVGAVVVAKDKIIARSHNLTEMLCDVTAHAEMQAITSATNSLGGKYLNECTLYVTLEAMHNVCWSDRLVAVRTPCLWCN